MEAMVPAGLRAVLSPRYRRVSFLVVREVVWAARYLGRFILNKASGVISK